MPVFKNETLDASPCKKKVLSMQGGNKSVFLFGVIFAKFIQPIRV